MKILVTESQFSRMIFKEQEEIKEKTDDCVPELPKTWNTVDYSLRDVLNGEILHYGDEDSNDLNALKLIQKRLNSINNEHFTIDGKYGPNILKRLLKYLNEKYNEEIDLCEQKDNDIPIGPNTLTKLGLNFNITPENKENYILTSTLVGERLNGTKNELFAILSTIKNRALKCEKTMQYMVLLPKQYSTWNYYNNLSEEEKEIELFNRVANDKSKGYFNKLLKIVKEFKNTKPSSYNHYVANYLLKDTKTKSDSIINSYKENKDTSKKIGLHTFWWDNKHRCK
jgi:hypothetical protein